MKSRKPDKYFIDMFRSSGNFPINTYSFRKDRENPSIWWVTCKVCNEDQYSKILGEVEFKGYLSNLRLGSKPCRCTPSYAMSVEERSIQLTDILSPEGHTLCNITAEKVTSETKVKWVCKKGHICCTRINDLITGRRCGECSKYSSLRGYFENRSEEKDNLYIALINGCSEYFKIGRTFDPKERNYGLKSKLKALVELHVIATGVHREVFEIEQEIVSIFSVETDTLVYKEEMVCTDDLDKIFHYIEQHTNLIPTLTIQGRKELLDKSKSSKLTGKILWKY